MGKTLYLECYSGISGDMTAAALLDLGADREVLDRALKSLPVQGFEVKISRVIKSGIDACDFDVVLDKEHENHDHDMEYLHGHDHADLHVHTLETHEHTEGAHSHEHEHEYAEGAHSHEHAEETHSHNHEHAEEAHSHSHEYAEEAHSHSHEHTGETHSHEHEHAGHSHSHEHAEEAHSHEHEHAGQVHNHTHEHRGMKEITEIIQAADITEGAEKIARNIFEVLAKAEAKAHNVPVDQVHFHEVGAVDSIVDILSVAVCLDNLNVTEVIIPELYEGRGTVRCQHGILPIPVPAVANIVSDCGLKLHMTEVKGELVTPTGAAIAAAVRSGEKLPGSFSIEKIGIGAGKRQYECPGILRAMLIQVREDEETITKLETNIDDCTGEALGYVMEQLFHAGARDVQYTPVFMKKNRPAWLLTVLCKEEKVSELETIIFRETTSIGIRRIQMKRTALKREQRSVKTEFGMAEVKVCILNGKSRIYPEYESVKKLCQETGRSYQEVYRIVAEAAEKF